MTDILGTIGTFPNLIDAARDLAVDLSDGEMVEIPTFPGFWVLESESVPAEMSRVTFFRIDSRHFLILENAT